MEHREGEKTALEYLKEQMKEEDIAKWMEDYAEYIWQKRLEKLREIYGWL